MSQPSLSELTELYQQGLQAHAQRTTNLLAEIHNKLAYTSNANPLNSLNFESTTKFIRNFQQNREQRTAWAVNQQEEDASVEQEMRNEASKQLQTAENEICQIENQIRELRQTLNQTLAAQKQQTQKLLELQAEQIKLKTRQNPSQIPYEAIGFDFAFKRDENGSVFLDQDYAKIVQHLKNRYESNIKLIMFYQEKLQKQIRDREVSQESMKEYRGLIKKKEDCLSQLKKAREEIKGRRKILSEEVEKFEKEVESQLNQELTKVLDEKRPTIKKHQKAYAQLLQLMQEVTEGAQLAQISNFIKEP